MYNVGNLMKFKGRDIIRIDDFSKEELLYFFKIVKKFQKKSYPNLLKDKIVALLFFEPSTRTHQSFSSAAQKLGAGVIGFDNQNVTSITKGESFTDTLKVISSYSDIIVLRHPEAGSAKRAADIVKIPVINAGDGPAHHPTQTLIDLFTVQDILKRLNNLKIAFVGDPKHYRTMHGQLLAFSKFTGNEIYGISPKGFEMPDEFRNSNYHDVFINMKDLDNTLAKLQPDIVSIGRIPREYIKGRAKTFNFKITVDTIKKLPSKTIIMHPLPRVDEIDPEVDNYPNAVYFRQAENGLYVREALLALILGKI